MDRAVVAASWKLLCPSTSAPRLFLLSLLPTFSPKAPFILWNLINQEPFSELVNGAVATSGQGELDALCCPFLSVSYSLCLSGYKLVGDISLTSTGLKAGLQYCSHSVLYLLSQNTDPSVYSSLMLSSAHVAAA